MKLKWSWHALKRTDQMGIDPEEVEAALRRYSHSYPNPPKHPAGRVYVAAPFAVPVASDCTVLTVLWAGRTGREV